LAVFAIRVPDTLCLPLHSRVSLLQIIKQDIDDCQLLPKGWTIKE